MRSKVTPAKSSRIGMSGTKTYFPKQYDQEPSADDFSLSSNISVAYVLSRMWYHSWLKRLHHIRPDWAYKNMIVCYPLTSAVSFAV